VLFRSVSGCLETRAALAEAAADRIEASLREGLAARGRASLMLSGGSTPGPAYARLSGAALDWPAVTVGLVDERWVGPEDPRANARLVRETLLQGNASQAQFLPMVSDAMTPMAAEDAVAARYGPALEACDMAVLGMGGDGHTASWFPEAKGLGRAMDPRSALLVAGLDASDAPVAGDCPLRMTLTAFALAKASQVLLLVTGDEKRAVLDACERALPVHHAIDLLSDKLEILWAP
jgi:6-phosphogluconolactonase